MADGIASMGSIFGRSIAALEGAMRFRVARQSVLSANVANADTPGYRRFDLAMREASGALAMQRSNAAHLGAVSGPAAYEIERGELSSRPDRNGVDLDQELLQLSRNAGAFEQQAEVLSRLLSLRRIAVTGEPR